MGVPSSSVKCLGPVCGGCDSELAAELVEKELVEKALVEEELATDLATDDGCELIAGALDDCKTDWDASAVIDELILPSPAHPCSPMADTKTILRKKYCITFAPLDIPVNRYDSWLP